MVGITTSLTSGLPSREICTHGFVTTVCFTVFVFVTRLPLTTTVTLTFLSTVLTVTSGRSVAAQTPIVWLVLLSRSAIGSWSAIAWTA